MLAPAFTPSPSKVSKEFSAGVIAYDCVINGCKCEEGKDTYCTPLPWGVLPLPFCLYLEKHEKKREITLNSISSTFFTF